MSNVQLIFGKSAIIDALKNGLSIEKIIAVKPHHDLLQFNAKLKFEIVNQQYFNQYKDVNHQQIVAVMKQKINFCTLEQLITRLQQQPNSTILVVDGIEDSHNLGALIRTSVGYKVDAIIYKNHHQAPINEVAIKTSMGAVYYLDFVQVANLNQAIEKLKQAHWWVYTTSLNEKAVPLSNVEFDKHAVIIVGNEHAGVSKILQDNADFLIKIEMDHRVQSLNVSVATGIILYKNYLTRNS